MKKLMIAALGLAAVGSVFGAPQVFDYKASVKHMYLKEVKVSGVRVYQKYAKSASLKDYLIMDEDGATSPTINANNTTATAFDHGRSRGFLVVQNSKAEKKVRAPKILPAVLDAKWFDNVKKGHNVKSGLAEGTLFLGGDSVACVRSQIDDIDGTPTVRSAAPTAPAAAAAGMSAYADYVWTSVYLFGQFNGPNWYSPSAFEGFETAWDDNLPNDLQTDWANKAPVNYFHDTWMNGAGIGKYLNNVVSETVEGGYCCGLPPTVMPGSSSRVLYTLSGSLKGGLFLCTENGIRARTSDDAAYWWFDGTNLGWEDQFNSAFIENDPTDWGCAWLQDIWNDGAVEQATTDVIYGSWSIKWNKKFYYAKGGVARDLTASEIAMIDPVEGTEALWGAIKGATLKLKSSAAFYQNREIYAAEGNGSHYTLPVVTPQFAKYYGLGAGQPASDGE